MPTENTKFFSYPQWNAIGADIREELATYWHAIEAADAREEPLVRNFYQGKVNAICELALRFAARFKIDNDEFHAVDWLLKCSPNDEVWPLAELLEDK